ncbi:MAG: glycosyltransferase [bacterium]|nr:glycosyltransferase [bacterium]
MEPLVSIIVPVYNAENYLVRCVGSVLNQEYTNFELLLVDDGSRDNSGAVCDGFAQRDGRVRVIHKENTGVSDSRNCALEQAKGKYIQFLDSDDWLTPEATKLFVRSAEASGCDMVIADFYRVSGGNLAHKGDIEKEGLLTRQEFAVLMMENPADFYYGVLWNKLFRRELIDRLCLRMDPQISWCEDFIFNLEYLRHCRSIYALNVPVYYYVKTKGSLVNSQGASINNTIRMKLNVFEYYNQFYKEIYDEESYDDIRFQVYRFFVTGAKDGFVPPSILPGSVRLGQERQGYALPQALEKEGPALDYYRYRKLWECCCERAADRNDMSRAEAMILIYLNQGFAVTGAGQLAELTGLTRHSVSSAIQKLEKRQLVKRESGKRKKQYLLCPAAEPVLAELKETEQEFEEAGFLLFSEEERQSYRVLAGKMQDGIKSILRERRTRIRD